MVYVNRGNHNLLDMKRVPKKSFYWFKDFLQKEYRYVGGIQLSTKNLVGKEINR